MIDNRRSRSAVKWGLWWSQMYGQRSSIKVGKRLMTPLYICTLLTPTLSSKTKWYANPTSPPNKKREQVQVQVQFHSDGEQWIRMKRWPMLKKMHGYRIKLIKWNVRYPRTGPNPTQQNQTKPNETQHIHRKNVHLLRGVCTRRVFRHKTRNFFVFRIFLHSPQPKSVKRIEALWKKKR